MQQIRIVDTFAEVNDYSPFTNKVLLIKFEEVINYIKARYGALKFQKVISSVGKDSFSFSIWKDLNDVFGLNFYQKDPDNDIQHHITMLADFEMGKGKKNAGKNKLTIRTAVSVPGSSDANPYYVLYHKFETYPVVEFKSEFSSDDFIADPLKYAKQIESAVDTTIQRVKDAWVELHDEQISRDIELMNVPDMITEAFAKHGVPVKSEFKNSLTYAEIHVTTEYNPKHVGYMILHYADGGKWEFTETRGNFDFIDNLFDLRNSSYDKRKKTIKFEKFGELMEIIARQYLTQVKTQLDFKAKLNDYMDCCTK